MTGQTEREVPGLTIGDAVHTVVRTVLSGVPYIGGPGVELFAALVKPPLVKRQERWMQTVTQRLAALEAAGRVRLGDLQDNEAFISIVMQATHAALRTHQQEKLDALRNAVLNAAAPNPPEDSVQQMFVNLVDTFTVWHLRLLSLLQDPSRWFGRQDRKAPGFAVTSSLRQVIEAAYPELNGRRDVYDLVGSDLLARGLINTGGFHVMMTPQGALGRRTTSFGDGFLRFVSEP